MAGLFRNLAGARAIVLLLGGAAGLAHAEITPMSCERLAEAETLGRKALEDSEIIHTGSCRTSANVGVHLFEVSITTPFASLAYAVFLARQHGTSLDPARWPIEPVGNQVVIVTADPAALSPIGAPAAPPVSVRKVVLRRGGQVVEALRADTHDVHFPELDKEHRTVRGGAFYFPLAPFASGMGDLEIVVIPAIDEPGAEAALELDAAELARLR